MQDKTALTDQDAWAQLQPSCIDCEWLYRQYRQDKSLTAADALQQTLAERSCKCVGGSWPHVPTDWIGIE